ncbi:MAG TPA: septum site-determining protein MinD [Clostridiales bacterium]|nr:septum site-determining protein MinD [Clostridiales bacterium]
MARKIVICSGKGGVGKTAVCANLGMSLAKMGLRTVLIDTDIGLNNLDVAMGIENKIVYDIIDVIENRCRVKQALIPDAMYDNLCTLASHGQAAKKITGANIKYIVNCLAESFDYILLDCPAGIEVGFHRAVAASDEAIIVTTPHISSIRDADKVVSILNNYMIGSMSLIINRVRGDLILNYEMLDIDNIIELLGIMPLGVVPESDDISAYTSMGARLKSGSEAQKAFDILAHNLHYGTQKMYDCTSKFKGVLGKIKRNLKRMG